MTCQEVRTPALLPSKLFKVVEIVTARGYGELSAVQVKLLKKIALWHSLIFLGAGANIRCSKGVAAAVHHLPVTGLAHLREGVRKSRNSGGRGQNVVV